MVEARADVTLPVPPEEAFAVVADIEHADWLPAIRRLRHPRNKRRRDCAPRVCRPTQKRREFGALGLAEPRTLITG